MQSEAEKIKQQYESRKNSSLVSKNAAFYYYYYFIKYERELKYLEILKKHFTEFSELSIIEIGAAHGSNLYFFQYWGLQWKNIYANELLEERGEALKNNLPNATVHICDALDLDYENKFDIVFQSTVFTSILSDDFKKKLAKKMFAMTKAGGIILWYDFKYNNPKNKDVKGVSKREVCDLFSEAKHFEFYNVTLAPPIGRRMGKLYPIINTLFPFLRTHIVSVIHK